MPFTPDLRRPSATTGGSGRAGIPQLVQRTFPHVSEEQWAGYNAVILLVSLIAIGMLAVGVVVELTPTTRSLLAYVDLAVCVVFMIDFCISLARAPNRWQYLLTWGWIDLLSSIPALGSLRWGRAARVVRILRVIRSIKAARFLAAIVFHNRARNALLAGSFVAVVVVFLSSFAILQFESHNEGNITSAEDAIWWALCTVTTVGYGDLYPVTWEGRVVAFILMVTGASSFGALSGLIAGSFVQSEDDHQDELRDLTAEVATLRQLLESRVLPGLDAEATGMTADNASRANPRSSSAILTPQRRAA
jgi:voltage-gated potassium channel